MEETLRARYFVEAAVETSIYVEPRDPGLSLEELTKIGARFGVRPGAIRDAVVSEADMVERPVRGRVRLKAGNMYTSIHVSLQGDRRNVQVYEKVARSIRTHLEELGKDATEVSREQIARLDSNGHAIDVELAMMELEQLVKLTANTVTITQIGVSYFREFDGVGPRPPWSAHRPRFAEILAQVAETIRLRPAPVASAAVTKTRPESVRVPMKRIFISHATQNKTLANKFVRLILEGGIGVHADEIFLSSRPGSIPAGQYFIPYIRDQLTDARVVISLITPAYRTRPFCVCELGAAWAFVPNGFVPVLHRVKYQEMDGVLQGMQAVTLSDPQGLNELRKRVTDTLSLQERDYSRWEEERNEFIGGLAGFEATDAAAAVDGEQSSPPTVAMTVATPAEPRAAVLRKVKALATSLRASEGKKATMPYISPAQAAMFNTLLQEAKQAGGQTTLSPLSPKVEGFGATFGTTATSLSDLIGMLEMLAAELEG